MTSPKYDEAVAHTIEHFAEYYQQLKDDLNVLKLIQRVYKADSENMLNLVKNF